MSIFHHNLTFLIGLCGIECLEVFSKQFHARQARVLVNHHYPSLLLRFHTNNLSLAPLLLIVDYLIILGLFDGSRGGSRSLVGVTTFVELGVGHF